ncbi:MAG: alpha/beta hydrolase fold domain-containing protein [Steroidobacteraceae bacterium]
MSFDFISISRRIRTLGTEISPEAIQGTAALYAPFHEHEPYRDDVRITRDVSYGENERQRLDIFEPAGAAAPQAGRKAPVLMFVHGGGFVGGDKHMPGSPYNDNVALWAVRHGLVGINITYRLAPQFRWPSGAEDVAAAVAWARAHIGTRGGDPERIFLLGTSAGAVHAASYVAHAQFHGASGSGVAGAILLSGMYDLTTAPRSPMQTAYFGEDDAQYRRASTLSGLVESPVPLLFVITEMDPLDFQKQALGVLTAWTARHGRWPRLVHMVGHNHLSSTMHLNTPDTFLGETILDLIDGSSAG